MNLGFTLIFNSVLLGVGLAMDAFSVSLANGLNEPCMRRPRMTGIAGIFAFFQALMPLLGWICIHTIAEHFQVFEKMIPWIALVLLCFIGGKMMLEGIRGGDCGCACGCGKEVGLGELIVQGIATSIDALSVGFTIAEYDLSEAIAAAVIIAAVTFFICLGGIAIGKKAGMKLSGKAGIFGGLILIFIGIEIFVTGVF